MKILIAGNGPDALLAAFLLRKRLPDSTITIAGLSSAETQPAQILANPVTPDFALADVDAHAAVAAVTRDVSGVHVIRSHANGMPADEELIPGLAYKTAAYEAMRDALSALVRGVGCNLAGTLAGGADADLILVSDRAALNVLGIDAAAFEPSGEDNASACAVFAAAMPCAQITFAFAETDAGMFSAMLVPESTESSSIVVEASSAAIEGSYLADVTADGMLAFCTKTFESAFDGLTLTCAHNGWRKFVSHRVNKRISGRCVLFGSATAAVHHSIGLQTRHDLIDAETLADAIVLATETDASMQDALLAWQDRSMARSGSYQRSAGASAHWLANAQREFDLPMDQFAFACATRTFRMGYARVRRAAPDFTRKLDTLVAATNSGPQNDPPPPMFAPYQMRGLELPNRMVFSPMCMYSASDGTPDDFHTVHLGARAVGGFGLVIAEMTNVTAQGRMTPGCAGMYAPQHVPAWKRVTDYAHKHTQSKIGIQLAHAGRKGSIGRSWEKYDPVKGDDMWEVIAPSAIPFTQDRPLPREMTKADIQETLAAFARAAHMSVEAGFDMIELHMAHGYLISSFISPLSNQRGDAYGGSLQNRMRFPLEVFAAVRAELPDGMPIAARISATDFRPDGVTPRDSIEISRMLHEAGCDIIAVSTAGVTSERRPAMSQRLYQLALCEAIRHEAKVPTMAIGGLVSHTDCNMIIASGRADLCVMARGAMNDAYFPHHAAREQGYRFDWPLPYARADETFIRPS